MTHEHIVFADELDIDALEGDHEDARILEIFDFDGSYAAHIEAPGEAEASFASHDWVSGVYENFEAHIDIAPREEQYDLDADPDDIMLQQSNGVADFDSIDALQEIPFDGSGVGRGEGLSVVVMDSGRDQDQFDAPIPQFDMTRTGNDTDDVGHGTATAGLVDSYLTDADLKSLRIFGDRGTTSGNVILRAYQWLLGNADSIDFVNMSWGSSQEIPEIDRLHGRLLSKGVLAVVSAGNSGGASGSPAIAKNAFSVGAVNLEGELTSFSSYNPEDNNPDTCAVGKNVLLRRSSDGNMGTPVSVGDDGSIRRDDHGRYTVASGTSFSAPIQTAMAGMLLTTNDVATELLDLPSVFESTSADIPNTNHDGHGIAQLKPAIGAVQTQPTEPPTEPDEPEDPSDSVPRPVKTVSAETWSFSAGECVYISDDLLPSGALSATKRDDGSVVLESVE